MTRHTHLVGAWPGYSAPHAIDTAFTRLGPWLDRLSDGETGLRSQWVTPMVEALRANPTVEMLNDGDYSHYEKTPKYKVREGHSFTADSIDLGLRRAFEGSYPAFKELRSRHGYPEVRFQVGVPSPVDLALVGFGPAGFGSPDIITAYLAAEIREINEIVAQAEPEGVVFQFETIVAIPVAAQQLGEGTHRMDEQEADRLAQVIGAMAAVASGAPQGTHFGVHFCLGDFNHEAFSSIGDASPIVRAVNTLIDQWPADRTLDYVHVPFAAASDPPPSNPDFYAPLADLRVPDDVRFVAGFIHESVSKEDQAPLLAVIEQAAGREVDVAATCGLGRRPSSDQAWDAMDKTRALLEAAG